jgi:hypothetical protein
LVFLHFPHQPDLSGDGGRRWALPLTASSKPTQQHLNFNFVGNLMPMQ